MTNSVVFLYIDVEALAAGTLRGLGGQLALLEQQRQQGEQGVSVIKMGTLYRDRRAERQIH